MEESGVTPTFYKKICIIEDTSDLTKHSRVDTEESGRHHHKSLVYLLIPFICWIPLLGQRNPCYMGTVSGIGATNIRHSRCALFISRT